MKKLASAPLPATLNKAPPPDWEGELVQIRQIISLAAFAAEARRVLTAVDMAAEVFPDVGATLSNHILARGQWSEHPDELASVLEGVNDRLELLLTGRD